MASEILRPAGAGFQTNIAGQSPGSGEHQDKVDEATADDASTYVRHNSTTYGVDTYALPAGSGSGEIENVRVTVRCYGVSGSYNYARTVVRSHGTNYEGGAQQLSANWVNISTDYTLNPYTNQPWTWSEIEALEAGVALKSSSNGEYLALCTQVFMEVTYYTETPRTSNDAGAGEDTLQAQANEISGAEIGSGVTASSQAVSLARDGSGNSQEGTIAEATLDREEAGAGSENTMLLAPLMVEETGSGMEELTSSRTLEETGSGLEEMLSRLVETEEPCEGEEITDDLVRDSGDRDMQRSDAGNGEEAAQDRDIVLPGSGAAAEALLARELTSEEWKSQALCFDGSSDYVDCGNSNSLNAVEAISIEAWIKLDHTSGAQTIAAKRDETGATNYALQTYSDKLNFYFTHSGGWCTWMAYAGLAADSWYYIACVYTPGSNPMVYVNGVAKNGYWDWGSPQTMDLTSGSLRLGRSAAGNAMSGAISQMMISTVARSQGEIEENWNGGLGRKFDVDAGTAALWRMHEEAGSVICDATDNQNHGTLYGAVWVEGPGFPSAAEGVALLAAANALEDGAGAEGIDDRKSEIAESGCGMDAASLYKLLQAIDSGVGLEALALILGLANVAEAGSGADRLRARVMTAKGTDMRFSPGFSQADIPSKEVKP